jgi:hypothetical protein
MVPLRFLPAEDAVILFQYSRNLATPGAITYLANGPHVEGATDFAWVAPSQRPPSLELEKVHDRAQR